MSASTNGFDFSRRSLFASAGLIAASVAFPKSALAQKCNLPNSEKSTTLGAPIDMTGCSREEIEAYSLELAKMESEQLLATLEEHSEETGILRARPTYVNEYGSPTYSKSGFRFVEGQPANGYSFSNGGSIIVNLSGGSSISVSFSFPLKHGGSIGISVPFARTSTISGVTVNIPAGARRKVKMNLEYVSTPYTTYYIDSNGNKSVYAHLHSTPVISAHDYITVTV